jgi:hypothetical protein
MIPQLTIEWKILPGTDERYGINQIGQIKNLKTNRVLKQYINKKGFLKSNTCVNYKMQTWVLHLWVAKFFVPNPRNLKEVRFKDGNKLNVFSDNLEWVYHHAHRFKAYKEYGNDQLRDYYNRGKKQCE